VSVLVHHADCVAFLAARAEAVARGAAEPFDSCVTDAPYHLTSIVRRFGQEGAAPAKKGRGPAATGAFARASVGFMGKKWDGGDVAMRAETWRAVFDNLKPGAHLVAFGGTRTYHRMACAIEDAGFEIRDQLAWVYGSGFPKSHNQPGGWGTALKPAWEPICLARKPLAGTVAANVLAHGTGALNIDGCRVEGQAQPFGNSTASEGYRLHKRAEDWSPSDLGRWPGNILHDGSDDVLAMFPVAGGAAPPSRTGSATTANTFGHYARRSDVFHDDAGSAARFFYSAKAGPLDRLGSSHPTVKPVDLMRWLVRLVTPAGGTILDPFAGSGTTGIAAIAEGFSAELIDIEAEHIADIERKLALLAGEGRHRIVEHNEARARRAGAVAEALGLFAAAQEAAE
jgi:site-specific DNA-methyltransferase (adenine-specific)